VGEGGYQLLRYSVQQFLRPHQFDRATMRLKLNAVGTAIMFGVIVEHGLVILAACA
jgi:hypothetical protein